MNTVNSTTSTAPASQANGSAATSNATLAQFQDQVAADVFQILFSLVMNQLNE